MITRVAWASVTRRPLTTILCVLLITFGTSITSLLLLVNQQMEQKFANDLAGTDLVLGAKGSPLQLVLSAVYHLDAPTGNISLAEAAPYLESPLVKQAIPLAYGDTYAGYRILGTTADFLDKYGGTLASGRVFTEPMEVVVGAEVAQQTGLKVGDTLLGAHGETADADVHADHPYTVVGIVGHAGNALDRLLLTPVASVWEVHGEHAHEHGDEEQGEHAHEHGDEEHPEHEAHANEPEEEITAVLLTLHSKRSVLTLPRVINQNTRMQAVLPALEINRLFYLLGIGTDALRLLGGGIMLVASISIFMALLDRMRERKHELAILRVTGYSRFQLFLLPVIEAGLLALLGYVFGLLLSRAMLWWVNFRAAADFKLIFSQTWQGNEVFVLLGTIALAVMAALFPAWRAMRVDVVAALRR
ncbi:ABC transporter permease [Neolewinella lacunae]|uniref:ABC transporter permease n=1 Tax=Neolewinella lacunae TaxID=1517758 RepID=A0A923PJB6_9BACT|nr:ABC transporter permease [Neolewinella lacunae]MBC6995130.1 ABC transporter permease [Neolewinella lacunae]MDN3634080.1 ABC transporter permease [Neolewinella lacunae]